MRVEQIANHKIHTGNLIVVNEQHSFRQEKKKKLLFPIHHRKQDILLDRQAGILLEELMQKIKGWNQIEGVSGWRSREEQQQIWDDSLRENGEEFTKTYVAIPGHSEHQTGLAIDLGLKGEELDFICPSFPYEGICGKFRKYASQYGFVERYPKGKERVTGIGHEPWHFRYVGVPHATIMEELNITLEEYMEFIKDYQHGKREYEFTHRGTEFEVSYLSAEHGQNTNIRVDEQSIYRISGNNMDGFVVTKWRCR